MFESAEGQVCAAMRAVALDQAVASLRVAKQNQVFAEQFDRANRARSLELVEQCCWLPVHPHQLAARVFPARAGDQVVLFLAHHGASPHPKKACDGRQSKLVCSSIEQMFNYRITTSELRK